MVRLVSIRIPSAFGSVSVVIASTLMLACVGSSETGSAEDNQQALLDEAREKGARQTGQSGTMYRDTVPAMAYRVFKTEAESKNPKKTTYRLLVLEQGSRDAMSKTLRLALDSIGKADPELVAARGVLYEYRPSSSSDGRLSPRVWGEWIPPEGWTAASAESRGRHYRVYIYLGGPGWTSADSTDAGNPHGR